MNAPKGAASGKSVADHALSLLAWKGLACFSRLQRRDDCRGDRARCRSLRLHVSDNHAILSGFS